MIIAVAMKSYKLIKIFRKLTNENIYTKILAKNIILAMIKNFHLGNKYMKV